MKQTQRILQKWKKTLRIYFVVVSLSVVITPLIFLAPIPPSVMMVAGEEYDRVIILQQSQSPRRW